LDADPRCGGGPRLLRPRHRDIWLASDALDALHQPVAPFTDFFSHVFAYSKAHGWDAATGGFFDSCPAAPEQGQ
jgi:hypothetical protein